MFQRIAMLLAVLTLGTATSTSAQTELGATSLGTQFAISLESNSNDVRAHTLQKIADVATFHPEFDLTSTVPSLVEVYRRDPSDEHRIMAVVALYNIGNEKGMQKVREHLLEQRDRRVQVVSIEAVRRYFGAETFRGDKEVGRMARHLLETR